jgi:hypothetical protein
VKDGRLGTVCAVRGYLFLLIDASRLIDLDTRTWNEGNTIKKNPLNQALGNSYYLSYL